MDIISAYQQLGSYRAAADICGTTAKTVKRVVDKFEADQAGVPRQPLSTVTQFPRAAVTEFPRCGPRW